MKRAVKGEKRKGKILKKTPAKEKPKEAELDKKIAGKGKKFEKCYRALHNAKESIDKNDISKAKELYIEARNLYVDLNYQDKKEIYKELMKLYNRLLK